MGHNLILLKKGKTALSFGQETLAAGGNASNPLPEAVKIDVIANTKLLGPGEATLLYSLLLLNSGFTSTFVLSLATSRWNADL